MSRIIKFRGKRLDNGEWVYGYFYTIQEIEHYILQPCALGVLHTEVIPKTVGQFTGLLDKNGKEIYEGDILHTITFGFNPEEFTAIILYRNCRFQLSNGRNLFYFGQSDLTRMDDTIVIGNIHDNPDLIKEENK